MDMKGGQRHPILSWQNLLETKSEGARRTEQREMNERAVRLMERNMIYPDLGSSLRTMKGGTRERWQ